MMPARSDTDDELSSASKIHGLEVFGQAIANVGPTATVAGLPAVIALNAGQGAWLSMLIAMVVTMLIAHCIVVFSRHISSTGSLYTFVARSLSPLAAFVTGIALVAGYTAIAIACMLGDSTYMDSLLADLGVTSGTTAIRVLIIVIVAVVAVLLSYRGVKVATRVALVLELVSVAGIAILFGLVLYKNGLHVDMTQIRPKDGFSWNGILLGVTLGFASFVGFESAAALGAESSDPVRQIPRSIYLTTFATGIAFVTALYTLVLGFGSAADLAASQVPLVDLATRSGVGGLRFLIDVGVIVSYLACVVACLNAASRQLFTMGRERVLWRGFGRVSKHATPATACFALAPVLIAIPVFLLIVGVEPNTANGYSGTTGAFLFLLAYALVTVGAPLFGRTRGESTSRLWVVAVLAVGAIAFVFYKSVIPAPPFPFNVLPFIAGAIVGLAVLWYAFTKKVNPDRVKQIGSYERDWDSETDVAEPSSATPL